MIDIRNVGSEINHPSHFFNMNLFKSSNFFGKEPRSDNLLLKLQVKFLGDIQNIAMNFDFQTNEFSYKLNIKSKVEF